MFKNRENPFSSIITELAAVTNIDLCNYFEHIKTFAVDI